MCYTTFFCSTYQIRDFDEENQLRAKLALTEGKEEPRARCVYNKYSGLSEVQWHDCKEWGSWYLEYAGTVSILEEFVSS